MLALRLRAFNHLVFSGHHPDYYIFVGAISGKPRLACRTCAQDITGREADLRKRLQRLNGGSK